MGGTLAFGSGSTLDKNNPAAERKSLNDERFGLQVGYNWGLGGNTFWGIEGDVRVGELTARWEGRSTNQYNSYYTEDTVKNSLAVKAKFGVARERMSVYGVAGAIWAQTSNSLGCDRALVVATNGCVTKFEDSKDSTTTGYVLGIGSEYLVSDNLSLKMEYLHTELSKNSVTLSDPNYPNSPVNGREFATQFGEVSLGVNYRF